MAPSPSGLSAAAFEQGMLSPQYTFSTRSCSSSLAPCCTKKKKPLCSKMLIEACELPRCLLQGLPVQGRVSPLLPDLASPIPVSHALCGPAQIPVTPAPPAHT